jgi:hypothetical protein
MDHHGRVASTLGRAIGPVEGESMAAQDGAPAEGGRTPAATPDATPAVTPVLGIGKGITVSVVVAVFVALGEINRLWDRSSTTRPVPGRSPP